MTAILYTTLDTDEKLLKALRAEADKLKADEVKTRNACLFSEKEMDKCDAVIVPELFAHIAAAYEAKGVKAVVHKATKEKA